MTVFCLLVFWFSCSVNDVAPTFAFLEEKADQKLVYSELSFFGVKFLQEHKRTLLLVIKVFVLCIGGVFSVLVLYFSRL